MNPRLLCLLLLASALPSFANVTINTTSVPNGTVKSPYSAIIQASNGCLPYKWTIVSGALPAGVTAKASTTTAALDLSGTPTRAANYSFTVKVAGCGGYIAQVSYKVVIQPGANHIVDLNWKASTTTDVVGYNVYRSPNATTWTKINPSLVASTLYTDSTVANGSTYYYAATAVDVAGKESVKTAPVKAVVP
jgi:Putative Ig domain